MSSAVRVATLASHITSSSCGAVRPPVRVLITGAAGQIGYSLSFIISRGHLLGPQQPIILHLLDIPPAQTVLEGVVMELEDGAFPVLAGVVATTDVKTAFTGVDLAFLVGAFPRRPGMERKELLSQNAQIFREQGAALDRYASRDVKVLVVGNPANTNALIALKCAPSLSPSQFSAMTRLDHNRALAMLAKRLAVPVKNVSNVIIWGNHSSTQYPDITVARVATSAVANSPVSPATSASAAPVNLPVIDMLEGQQEWYEKEFIPQVQQRGAAVLAARKLSSSSSAAQAAVDHMRAWVRGTCPGEIVSMAVPSDGSYGIPAGVVFSFPVVCAGDGTYVIVQNVPVSPFSRARIQASYAELCEERSAAFDVLGLAQ